MKKVNDRGFGAVEAVVIVLVVVLIAAAGWFVYKHNQKKPATNTTKTTTSSNTSTSKSPPATGTTTPSVNYYTIKEWGVKAPYSGQDTLTYTLKDNNGAAVFVSKKLASEDSGCATFGAGQISRYLGTDVANEDGTLTIEQNAKANPGLYTHIGNYYYQFVHDQSQCGNAPIADQNQANDTVKSFVTNLQAE
ncbi:MAG TPA: hypothetical protein VLG11_01610 [Candidatus Saccharimonadales bacterium]|nr:hypothetical protein [Candidatus Saccharimonadales bacterium]